MPDYNNLPDEDKKRASALDDLFSQVGTYKKSHDYRELFNFIKRFPKISPYNAMLINIQKPGSQFVATAEQWWTRYHRSIAPGARPLVILQPFGPVRFVFEVGDTEGDQLPAEVTPFATKGHLPTDAFEYLVDNLPRDGISYHEASQGVNSAGSVRVASEKKTQQVHRKGNKYETFVFYNMIINSSFDKSAKFATIIHELGHVYCGHLGRPFEKWKYWPHRVDLNKQVEEFEAESVTWLVCERMGIENPSAEYLSGYVSANEEIPAISLETVLKATNNVESMLKKTMDLQIEVIYKMLAS